MAAAPALAQDARPAAVTQASLATNLPAATGYRIGADDQLEVAVFQNSDLSRTVQVDSSGRVLLPLIGQIDAAGLTPQQLSEKISAKLSEKYMRDPQVTVIVKESISQKVTVDGAVISPGLYPLAGPTTLLQAVALAKGPDPKQANTHKVSVFRMTEAGTRVASNYDLAAIRSGKAADPQIYPRDVVVVASSSGKAFMNNMGGFFPFMSLLRPY